jgi:hypothetical protein
MSYHEIRRGTKLGTFAVCVCMCTNATRLPVPRATNQHCASAIHERVYREIVPLEHDNYGGKVEAQSNKHILRSP